MSLVSIEYLIFLAVVTGIYFAVPKRAQWTVLLAANYGFYALAGIEYVPYLLFTTATTYLGSILLGRQNAAFKQAAATADRSEKAALKAAATRKKRLILVPVLLLNFGVLGLVKYSALFLNILNPLPALLSLPELQPATDWVLPLGISFYTFQAMGYLVDVYRDRVKPEGNFLKSALFLSFFPQLVQGPISRYSQLAPQLLEAHRFDYDRACSGGLRILWGFFKKLIIAERVAVISNWVFNPENEASGLFILLGAAAYSVRVYADFSGGMDVALGTAEILGIELTPNFLRPYFATDISDFWRRWHITLGAWFRDYIFYPLSLSKGLNKLGKWCRKHISLRVSKLVPVLISQFVVFTLIGVWHGSSLKYIAFGFYHGFLIVGSMLLESTFQKWNEALHIPVESLGFRVVRMARTFLLVVLGRILTMGQGLRESLGFVAKLVGPTSGSLDAMGYDIKEWALLFVAIGVLFLVSLLQEKNIPVRQALAKQALPIRWAVYLALIFSIMIFGVYGYGYDSSDFIYRGF